MKLLLQGKTQQEKHSLPSRTPQPDPSLGCTRTAEPRTESDSLEQRQFLKSSQVREQDKDNVISIPSPLAEGSGYLSAGTNGAEISELKKTPGKCL